MRLFPFFFCCFFAAHLQAQNPLFFRHFTEKDGLSSDNVTCILRSRDGYLWVGTNYGLNRYDGRNFRKYLPNSREAGRTVCHEYITALAEDAGGRIWIATRNGLSCYDPHTGRFQSWRHTGLSDGSLPNNLVTDLLADGDRLWMACDNRDLVCFNLKNGLFETYPWKKFTDQAYPSSAGKNYKTIYGFEKKSDHALFLHTSLGLMAFDTRTGQFEAYPTGKKRLQAYRPGNDCEETLFLGSWDFDVLCLDPCRRSWSQLRLPLHNALRDGFRRVLRVKKAGTMHWVLSQQGLYYFDADEGEVFPVLAEKQRVNHAPEGLMQAFFADSGGLLWFGGEKGLWMLDPALQHFHFLPLDTTPYASYYNRYSHLLDVPSVQRRFVADLYRGQLLVIEKGRWIKTLQLGGPAYILQQDNSGRVWVSGGMHLYQLDPSGLTLTPFPVDQTAFGANPGSYLTDFEIDKEGNFWLAGSDCGIMIYSPEQKRWQKPGAAQGFIAQNCSCLYADGFSGAMWIGTQDYGLFRYVPGGEKFELFRHDQSNPKSLPAYMVRDVGYYRSGYLWVASDPGGLSRFDCNAPATREFSNFSTDNGLPSNQVCSIVEDGSGRLWVGTTKGLAYVDRLGGVQIGWTKNRGLRNEYLDLPLSAGADGNIYMGGTQGLEYFHPDSLLHMPFDRRILLNAFKVFDRDLTGDFGTEIVLPWQDNFFSVEFVSADFAQADRIQYSAQLENYEEIPQNLGNRNYRAWTNVPPGKYLLRISAFRPDGFFSSRTLSLVITPPYWQSWWFRLAVFLVIAGLLYGLYRFRLEQVRREERLKSEFNQKLAQVEMSALRAQMNPHFVFNCLNSIKRFILVNDPDAASEYLTKFARLIRLILDNSRAETVSLDRELEALRLYIEMEVMRFDHHFDYVIELDPRIQPEHVELPPMLIQPYVENAIWHGLMHKKAQGRLSVLIGETAGGLSVCIEDDGVGRARAQAFNSKSAQVRKSHGMQLTHERLEIIRRLYGVDTGIKVEDLYDSHGAAAGTRVTLTIPRL